MSDRVDIKMELKAHHMDDQRPAARYPASLLTEICRERGNSLHPPNAPWPEAEDKEDSA
jgi:hypothetical protein